MDTAIFKVSEFTVNSFIYCCLIFNTIKRTRSKKSPKKRDRLLRFAAFAMTVCDDQRVN